MSASVLDEIIETTRGRLEARKAQVPLSELAQRAQERSDFRPFRASLRASELAVIAEHKRSSPSSGVIRADLELSDVVSAYERAGAAALSVLTEETHFGGSLDDLTAARAASSLPILRKDFIVDEYQVYEALAAGADAILLIVAALEVGPLADLHTLARELGLATIVEVHDADELETALELAADTIGINNRNLATLKVDTETTYQLFSKIPANIVVVAESGFSTRHEMERLADVGIDAVLVGEALMRAPDVEAACRELTGAHAAER